MFAVGGYCGFRQASQETVASCPATLLVVASSGGLVELSANHNLSR
jgi:hypothetical protein